MSLVWTSTQLPKKRPEIWRRRKDEMHKAQVAFNEDRIIAEPPLFAVLDGHGGQLVGQEAEKLLRKKLGKKRWTKAGESEENALVRIFGEIDRELYTKVHQLYQDPEVPPRGMNALKPWRSGSTCTAVKIARNGRELLCASLGDSQLYGFEYDEASGGHIVSFAGPLHSATDPAEIARVEQAGGKVYAGRVGGVLAVARSFGDFDTEKMNSPFSKKPRTYPDKMIVSAVPDVARLPLQSYLGEEVWWVLASDGLWDIVDTGYVAEILDEIREDYGNIPWEERIEILTAMLPHATRSREKWIRRKRNGKPALPPVYDLEKPPKMTEYPHDDRSIIVFVTNLPE